LIGVFLEDIMANRSAAEWLYKYGGFAVEPSQYVSQEGDSSSENFKVVKKKNKYGGFAVEPLQYVSQGGVLVVGKIQGPGLKLV
jgi:hypothetical protein